MAGLAEDAGGRADEHQRSLFRLLDMPQVAAGGEERGREVLVERLLPAGERHLRHGDVRRIPGAGVGDAGVEPPERLDRAGDERVGGRLVGRSACSATPPISAASRSAATFDEW